MEDKRNSFRFKLLLKGEVEIEVGANLPYEIHMTDFSRGGLRIFIPRKDFSSPNTVKLKVYIPHRSTLISIIGKVKWMRPKEGGLEIGAQIQQIDPVCKNEILDYAYNIWKDKKKEIKLT